MNKLEQKIYDLRRQLQCLSREVCTLSEGGTETDPIFTASPAFNITGTDVSNFHTHTNKAILDGISSTNITDWNTAYNNYFSRVGGTLTGISGNGYIGLPQQSAAPATPTNGFVLYADSANQPLFLFPNGLGAKFIFNPTATTKTYTFPDLTGNVILDVGTQTISGAKTFSSTMTSVDIQPAADIASSLGTTTRRYLTVSTTIVLSSGSPLKLRCSTGQPIYLQTGTDSSTVAGIFAADGTFFVQARGAIPTASNGQNFQSLGTSLLNGAVTLGGNITPTGDSTVDIGGATTRINRFYVANIFKGATGNSLNFSLTSPTVDTYARFHPTTHNFVLQSPATGAVTDTGERLQVLGTTLLNGATTINGLTTFGSGYKRKTSVSAASTVAITTANTIYVATGTTSTYTLPALTGNDGLQLLIVNMGSGILTLNSNAGANDIYDSATSVSTISVDPGNVVPISVANNKFITY